jgi:integrase
MRGIFAVAKKQNYFEGENPCRETAINPEAAEPAETYAYTLDEINSILAQLPEPAATAFAVAAYMGLRHGEIQGLLWENYRDGEMHITRSIWNGRITPPKTRKSQAPVPVIRQLADRLELHRLRSGNPQSGPIFANSLGNALHLGNLVNRVILPALNRCEVCLKAESNHPRADHDYKRDSSIPEWHGWHAARRGLGSNLHRLGVADKTIQRILRHANVAMTNMYYIKTADGDVLDAMARLEDRIEESAPTQTGTFGTPELGHSESPATIQ